MTNTPNNVTNPLGFDPSILSKLALHLLTASPDRTMLQSAEYMLCVHVSGGKLFQINDEAVPLEPYQLLLIPPHSRCRLVRHDADMPHEWLFMQVPAILVQYIVQGEPLLMAILDKPSILIKRPTYLPPLEYLHLKQVAAAANDAFSGLTRLNKMEAYNYMGIILCRLCHCISQPSTDLLTNTADALMQDVHNYIQKHFASDCSLDTLALRFGVSKYHLSHRFTQTFGITLHQFVLRCRISHAQLLILQREPMANLAIRCGFNDYSSFVRAFSSATGMTPAKWRDLQLHHSGCSFFHCRYSH